MILRLVKLAFFVVLLSGAVGTAYSQPDDPSPTGRSRRSIEQSLDLKTMLAKQRAERDKKEHKLMLDRGEEALRLASQLETAFEQNKNLTPQDRDKLESLERVVEKIRSELGGDDDEGADDGSYMKPVDEPKPSTLEEGFKYLHSTTIKLVDELKKTTRFTISAVAIQSSNSVLRLVRFLRLRK